jgi:hypothetical protein
MGIPRTYFALAVTGLLVASLTGCGGGATPSAGASTSTSVTMSATPTAAGATLLRTCPQVESSIITLNGVPNAEQYGASHSRVQALSNAGDLETQNALTGLLASLETLQGTPPGGSEYLDAHQAFLAALSDLAGRCKTVGSSALQ